MTRRLNRFAALLFALALALAAPGAAQAATLEIQFLGLDLAYNGASLHDAASHLGGAGSHATADPLTTMTFLVDGNIVGTLTSDIAADIFISNLFNIPAAGGVVASGGNGGAFGFDILTDAAGFGLALNIDVATILYGGNQQLFMSGGGVVSNVHIQDLPFGLVIDTTQPVTYAFSTAHMSNVTSNAAGFLTGFNSSGTGSIKASLVPEPASASLLALGALLPLGWRRRR